MPVFQRYSIERYKEILTTQPAGLVPDGGFSTYSLDDPNIVPNGTGDFLGVIKTVILLADVYKETIDTRNISFAQFNDLTQQEFDNYIRQGLILRNGATNGQPERIGWVEIGRSYASFYYQSCSGGKNPISEHFYDIQEFAFDNKIVYGEGLEVLPSSGVSVAQNTPLTPIGNFDPNNATNLGIIRPRFNPLSLNEYIKFAMIGSITNGEGETYKINNLSLTDQTRPSRVSLLMANKGEHFDNQYATEISPGKWGMVRRTISESLRPGVHVIYPQLGTSFQQNSYSLDFSISEGQCLQTTVITSTGGTIRTGGGVITTTPQVGGPMRPPTVIKQEDVLWPFDKNTSIPWDWGNLDKVDRRVGVTREYRNKTCFSLIHDFPDSLKKKLIFLQNSIDLNQLGGASSTGNIKSGTQTSNDYALYASRLRYLFMSLLRGEIPYLNSDIPDLMDALDIPRGTIRKEVNPNTGCIELTYIGTPVNHYVGPTILTPSGFGYDDSMDEPTPLILNAGDVRVDRRTGKSNQRFTESDLYWMKKSGTSLGINGGRGWWDNWKRSGKTTEDERRLLGLFEMVEEENPIYVYASDQEWTNGVQETKKVSITNRGGTRLIITDYNPRGCANFINVSLLNVLPVVLNPGETVEFQVEYIPRKTGLQSWKGKYDPFPSLLSDVEPNNYIIMEYDVYAEIPQFGYVPIDSIPDDPRKSDRWKLSKRNKYWSKLQIVEVVVGK